MARRSGQSNGGVMVIGVIPARLESERLPGKVLLPICGEPMLRRVYDAARRCERLNELWVATDSEQVRRYCIEKGLSVLMTSAAHRSGTERIHEVSLRRLAEVYVNIQGDEPMLQPGHLELLIQPFLEQLDIHVTTLKTPISAAVAGDPNVVKVVTDAGGRALYFSRAPIPYHGDADAAGRFYKHLGLYAYSREALGHYMNWPASELERTERLEQLRFLENGVPIHVAETPHDTIGVDTEADLKAVRLHFERASLRR